ncbi:MAG: hypothetical protein ACLP6W_10950, partial [Bryobacteraceae bacterium]
MKSDAFYPPLARFKYFNGAAPARMAAKTSLHATAAPSFVEVLETGERRVEGIGFHTLGRETG